MDFMTSKVVSGKYELLESNVVYMNPDDQELVIYVTPDQEHSVNVHLIFAKDTENVEFSTKTQISGNDLYITNINFENPLGIGSTRAVQIMQSGEQAVFFHYWVYKVGNLGTRRVEYNLFKER